MHNEELYKYVKDAITTSLEFLRKKSRIEPVSVVLTNKIKIRENKKFWYLEQVLEPQLESYVRKHDDEILTLPEVKSCIGFMSQQIPPQKIGIKTENSKSININEYNYFLGNEFIIGFLLKYAHHKNDFEFDESIFGILYSEMEEYIYVEGREIIGIAPLTNFDMKDTEEIEIGDFRIRKLTEDEIKLLIEFGLFTRVGVERSFVDSQWCIEFRKKVETKGVSGNIDKDIEKIIYALRLFKAGAISYFGVLVFPKVWGGIYSFHMSRENRTPIEGEDYIILNEDIENLEALWNLFKQVNITPNSFLETAIRRLNISYEKRLEDRIIDLMIVLEALFQDSNGELSYKLSLRCAYFIGKNADERKEIFDKLREAYKTRSKIVHGETKVSSLPDLVKNVDGYVREAIKNYLYIISDTNKSGENIKNIKNGIITKLEECIIKGDAF